MDNSGTWRVLVGRVVLVVGGLSPRMWAEVLKADGLSGRQHPCKGGR